MVMSTVSSMATSDLDNGALGDERRGEAEEQGQRYTKLAKNTHV